MQNLTKRQSANSKLISKLLNKRNKSKCDPKQSPTNLPQILHPTQADIAEALSYLK